VDLSIITGPAITTAATVIPGTDIITTIDAFTIAPPTIVVTITAGITVDITGGIIGTTMIDRRTSKTLRTGGAESYYDFQ
jgi:hypothetical protein